MKQIFTLLLLFLFSNLFAQENFELGYYIDQSGNKIEGEISAINLNTFPSSFKIRKSGKEETVETSSATIIKYGTLVFEKRAFQYDPSIRFDISNMPKEKEFKMVNKTAFVQLLVDGNTKLYKYIENGIATFFYENATNDLTTLNYKKYLVNKNEIEENKEFVNQLQGITSEKNKTSEGYNNTIKYNDADLVEYFTKINGKSTKEEYKSKVQFNVFVGYSMQTMGINFLSDVDAKKHNHFTVVPEIEYILNRNKRNATAFYFNAKLRAFKADFVENYERENWYHTVDYQSIYVALGAKQYFLSTEKTKFYGKFGVGLNNPIKSDIKSPPASWILNPIFLDGYSAGINAAIGLKLFDRILAELEYDTVFNTSHINKSNGLSFKVGYSF